MLTFSQIADGGDLEPQMFGLTTKFNKMSEISTTTETPAIGNLLLAEVKYSLRNFIGSGEKLEFIEVSKWKIKITAGDMCSNKVRAMQPLIDKYKLIWFVVNKNFTSGTEIEMHLYKPD